MEHLLWVEQHMQEGLKKKLYSMLSCNNSKWTWMIVEKLGLTMQVIVLVAKLTILANFLVMRNLVGGHLV